MLSTSAPLTTKLVNSSKPPNQTNKKPHSNHPAPSAYPPKKKERKFKEIDKSATKMLWLMHDYLKSGRTYPCDFEMLLSDLQNRNPKSTTHSSY